MAMASTASITKPLKTLPEKQSLSHDSRVSVISADSTRDGGVLHLNREYCKAVTARRAGHLDQPSPSVLVTDGKKDAD